MKNTDIKKACNTQNFTVIDSNILAQKTFNKCINTKNGKEVSRIWIEGGFLYNNGITSDMHYDQSIVRHAITLNQCIILDFSKPKLAIDSDNKKRPKIAGKDTRPIYDRCGAWLNSFFGDCLFYKATIYTQDNGLYMIIEPQKKG